MLISLTILALVVGSLLTVLTAGAVSLQRSDQKGTALAIADKQMELYRTLDYTDVELSHSLVPTTGTYVTAHSADITIPSATACANGSYGTYAAPCLVVDNTNGGVACTSGAPQCAPVQTISSSASPDHRRYEIDTYITYTSYASTQTVTGVEKRVLVIVRDPALTGSPILAREASTFQPLTTATS